MYKLFIATLCVVCCLSEGCKDKVKKNDITSIALRKGAKAHKGKLAYELSDVVKDLSKENRVRVAFKLDNKANFTIEKLHVQFKDGRVSKSVSVFDNDFADAERKKQEIEGKTDTIKFEFDPNIEVNKIVIETTCYHKAEDPENCSFKILQMDLCKV